MHQATGAVPFSVPLFNKQGCRPRQIDMSGLLSGIKFVPREESSGSSDSSSDSDGSRDRRREKKRASKHKKSKKEGKKSKKESRDRKRHYDNVDVNDDMDEGEARSGSKVAREIESDFDVKQFLKNNVNMDMMMRQISTENEEDSNDGSSQRSDDDPWGKRSDARKKKRKVNKDDYSSDDSDMDLSVKRSQDSKSKINNKDDYNDNGTDNKSILMGDEKNVSVAQQLRAKLQENRARVLRAQDGAAARSSDDTAVLIIDDYRSIALKKIQKKNTLQREDLQRGSLTGKLKTNKDDLSESDIRELVAAERLGGEDMDKVFEENILRLGGRYKGTEVGGKGGKGDSAGADEDEEVDMRLFQRAGDYLTDTQAMRRNIMKTLGERKKLNSAVERCQYCHSSGAFLSHLTLSVGDYTMLRLKPLALSLCEGHCEIVPLQHTSSMVQCEEEVWLEIERYKSCLRRMAEADGKVSIFTEVAMSFGKRMHCAIDCIPIKRSLVEDAKMRVLQALNSCDEEWGTHKRIMHTSAEKPLQTCVPKQFQYVYFEIEEKAGCYHIIDREENFSPFYCIEVINGLMKKDINFNRKGLAYSHKGDEETGRRAADNFAKRYGQYDWTQYIETM